ncbi:unnamed protein product [Pocillopora meandrina]|uniref:Uncharacterized protein n=1 Tax=Pocillopora meandrina TaxID=46732 RepID=A0AAU9WAV9_9CNID|nr:unnamed protein product [Pocillopora meandrina]
MVLSKKCAQYDYGFFSNYRTYGQLEAPEYHEEDMKTPTSLFSGSNDKLACPTDVRLLKDRITNLKYFRERDLKRFKAGIMLTFYLEIMHLSFFTQSLLI